VHVKLLKAEHGRVSVTVQGALITESLRHPVRFDLDLGAIGRLDDDGD
jgi:hypothetical protein